MRARGVILENQEKVVIDLFSALERAEQLKKSYRSGHSRLSKADMALIEFMAEIFPEEGLDIVLGQWPKADTRLATTYLCLFSSQTASTVITQAQTMADITESAWTNYARQSMAAATWGAIADDGTVGRKTTYPQVTFPTVGATGGTVNGFFISDILSTTGDKCIGQANFDDVTAVVLATNDVIKVTPTVEFLH